MAATVSRQLDACNISDTPPEASADSHGTMPWKEAQRSAVQYIPSLLDSDDIAAVFALGAEMSAERQWVNFDHSSAVLSLIHI